MSTLKAAELSYRPLQRLLAAGFTLFFWIWFGAFGGWFRSKRAVSTHIHNGEFAEYDPYYTTNCKEILHNGEKMSEIYTILADLSNPTV